MRPLRLRNEPDLFARIDQPHSELDVLDARVREKHVVISAELAEDVGPHEADARPEGRRVAAARLVHEMVPQVRVERRQAAASADDRRTSRRPRPRRSARTSSTSRSIASVWMITSASTNIRYGRAGTRSGHVSAVRGPFGRARIATIRAPAASAMLRVESVEPSSNTISSSVGCIAARSAFRHSVIVASALYAGTMTETGSRTDQASSRISPAGAARNIGARAASASSGSSLPRDIPARR